MGCEVWGVNCGDSKCGVLVEKCGDAERSVGREVWGVGREVWGVGREVWGGGKTKTGGSQVWGVKTKTHKTKTTHPTHTEIWRP